MKTSNRRRSRGFTITELVAVMAIVALLTPLLVAGMQASREHARQQQCKNHLKQLGLAQHVYHDAFGQFPPGWITPFAQAGSVPGYGWQAFVLPYIDQANLYKQIGIDRMPTELTPNLETVIPIYRCPSDTTENTNSMRSKYGTSNYSGNFGDVAPARWAPGPLAQFWPGGVDTTDMATGTHFRNSRIRLRDIKDGTTNTFMIGERCVTSAAGIWPGVTSNQNETDTATDCSFGNEMNSGIGAFSSLHVGGCQFVMCDGAVRFVSLDIPSSPGKEAEMGLYQKLANRNDHQIIREGF